MTKIKFCGMMREADIEAANEIMPDFVGFVFAPNRKRYVSKDKAAELKRKLNPSIKAVGVFVDAPVTDIVSLVKDKVINVIQLHGSEDEVYVQALKTELDVCGEDCFLNQSSPHYLEQVSIVKACRIESAQDLKNALEFPSDYLLLDNGQGGTGEKFDWELLKVVIQHSDLQDCQESITSNYHPQKSENDEIEHINHFRNYFLAGGLDAQNVAEAISELQPYAVDVSSGIETEGIKDIQKMKAFAAAVRKDEK